MIGLFYVEFSLHGSGQFTRPARVLRVVFIDEAIEMKQQQQQYVSLQPLRQQKSLSSQKWFGVTPDCVFSQSQY